MPSDWGDTIDDVGDDFDRRTVLRTLGGSALGLGLAGCASTRTRSYEARPVRLDQDAQRDGYTLRDEDLVETDREIAVDDDTIEATLTSHVVSYERDGETFVDDVDVGAVSTPVVDEFDVPSEPLVDEPVEALVGTADGAVFLEQLGVSPDWIRDPVAVRSGEGTLLGEDAAVRTFAGITSDDEFALLDAARIEHDGNVVLAGDARFEAVESTEGALVGDDGFVSREQVDGSARLFEDLLAKFVYDDDADEESSARTSTGGAPAKYVARQEDLGDSLVALGATNEDLSRQRSELVTMIYGAIANDEIEQFREAPLPPGFDREATFDPDPEMVERLAETEFLEHAPENEDEWIRTVRRYEELHTEADGRRSVVADAVDELRSYLERNGRTFVAEADEEGEEGGPTTVELHPRFADEPVRLVDSPWLISEQVTVIERDYPNVYEAFERVVDDLAEQLATTATATPECGPEYSLECVEASVDVVVGYGGSYNPFGHAWMKHTRVYHYVSPDCEEVTHHPYDPVVVTDEWGFYGGELRDDGENEVQCERDGWTGDPDDPDYEDFLAELEADRTGDPGKWSLSYNCLDWAIEMLEFVDEDRAAELAAEAIDDEGWVKTYNLIPDWLCKGG